jgi:hypothetical protein
MNYPDILSVLHLNSNDIQMLRNSGGTVICKTPDDIIIWLVNIEHKQDKEIGIILGNALLDIISNLRNRIKRDLNLNKIL